MASFQHPVPIHTLLQFPIICHVRQIHLFRLSDTDSNLLKPSHVIRRAGDAQLTTEKPPLAAGRLANGLREALAVTLAVGLLDSTHMVRVPVVSDEARDKQLAAQAVLAGAGDGVVEEEGVTHRAVDNAIENVREEFALVTVSASV